MQNVLTYENRVQSKSMMLYTVFDLLLSSTTYLISYEQVSEAHPTFPWGSNNSVE